jgi:excisionase family DNA binding protein
MLLNSSDLTIQQTAEVLQMPRSSVVRLLDNGIIPSHRARTTRLIRLTDLLDYKSTRNNLRHAHIRGMIRVSESLGLYDSDDFDAQES